MVEAAGGNEERSELPRWWRRAIEEFEEHGLPQYRPPRFQDGVLKHDIVTQIESEFGVTIRFVGKNATYGDAWSVEIDHTVVGVIERNRDSAGYSVFEMESEEFRRWITTLLEERASR